MWKYAVRASNQCWRAKALTPDWPGAAEAAKASSAVITPNACRTITVITLEHDAGVVIRDNELTLLDALVVLVDCFLSWNLFNLLVMNRVPFCAAVVSGLLLACAPAAYSQPLNFNTLAGYAGQGSADGTGSSARFYNPSSVAVDSTGNVYVADT